MNDLGLKTCKQCNKTKSKTDFDIRKYKDKIYHLKTCKECSRFNQREKRKNATPEQRQKKREYERIWKSKLSEEKKQEYTRKLKEYKKSLPEHKKEKLRKQTKEWRANISDELKEKYSKQSLKNYHRFSKEKKYERNKKNREQQKISGTLKRYFEKNIKGWSLGLEQSLVNNYNSTLSRSKKTQWEAALEIPEFYRRHKSRPKIERKLLKINFGKMDNTDKYDKVFYSLLGRVYNVTGLHTNPWERVFDRFRKSIDNDRRLNR